MHQDLYSNHVKNNVDYRRVLESNDLNDYLRLYSELFSLWFNKEVGFLKQLAPLKNGYADLPNNTLVQPLNDTQYMWVKDTSVNGEFGYSYVDYANLENTLNNLYSDIHNHFSQQLGVEGVDLNIHVYNTPVPFIGVKILGFDAYIKLIIAAMCTVRNGYNINAVSLKELLEINKTLFNCTKMDYVNFPVWFEHNEKPVIVDLFNCTYIDNPGLLDGAYLLATTHKLDSSKLN